MSLFRDLLIEKKRKPYYCEVEYLESSGTQYIDTGFKIDDTCGYDISWMALNANDTIIMGTKGAGDSRWVLSGNNNPNVNLSWNINYGRAGLGLNKIQTSQMNYLNGRKRVLNGIQITDISETLSADASTYSVCIFGGYWGSGTASLYSTCRLYYAKITKGLTLVRDLIPVLDWSMTPCMYDKVSGKLFYNAGTGTFTYGREIHYVDYLEATGTQYIDTGFKMENGKTMTFNGNIMWTQSDGSANFFYGYRSTNSATYSGDMRTFFIFGSNTATPGALAIRYGYASNNSQSDAVILNTKHNISFDGTTLSVDGSPKASVTGESQSPVYENMWLFDCNTTGYYSADVNKFIGRIYNWQILSGGVLVRDYLPAIDENGVGFMLDKVTHTIYDNAGSGTFKYPARELEYIEATGTQYLNTGWNPGANAGQFTFDVEVKCTSNSNGHGAIGSRSVDAGRNWVITNVNNTDLGVLSQYGYGSTYQNVIANTSDKWARFRTYINGSNYVFESTVDGVVSSETTTLQTFTNTANVYLMGINNKGSLFSNFPFIGQMRRARLYDRGTLVKDYRPAFKNGYFGLWDAVNDYLPGITGTVTHGKVVESRWF